MRRPGGIAAALARLVVAVLVALVVAAPASTPRAQTAEAEPALLPLPEVVRVAVRDAPPFTRFDEATGEWKGLSIDLWHAVTRRIQLERGLDAAPYRTEFVELELADTDAALARPPRIDGPVVDLIISPLTITAARERVFDFTHQYFPSGLAFAVPHTTGISFERAIERLGEALLNPQVGLAVALLVLASVAFAGLAFRASRTFRERELAEAPGPERALVFTIMGALKATGVDKGVFAFRSFVMVAFSLAMLAFGTVFSATVTGVVTASLTLSAMDEAPLDLADLADQRVGVLRGSTHEAYLTSQLPDIAPVRIDDGQRAGLQLLLDGEIDVFLGDAAQLRYLVQDKRFRGRLEIQRRNMTFEPYGWALPTGSLYREALNMQLIGFLRSPDWPRMVDAYYDE